MADIFFSYSKHDRGKAEQLALALEAEGWSVWWDRAISPGQTWEDVIEREIASASCVVVLWPENRLRLSLQRDGPVEGA